MAPNDRRHTSPAVGFWDGEEMELASRYAYRDEMVPLLLRYLGVEDGDRILDVGAGSGFLSRLLATRLRGAHVTAMEADERMLAIARRLVVRDGLESTIEVVPGDAYVLPFADDAFDVTTSHLVMCILNDPMAALHEQIRVTRPGGVVSAAICFCRTDRLPRYHGRWGLPGDHLIDQLNARLERAWRRAVRPGLLDLDHDIAPQDLAWHFRHAGLEEIRVDGHLAAVSPGDDRMTLEEAHAHALARMDRDVALLLHRRASYGDTLVNAGFDGADFDALVEHMNARLEMLRKHPERVRDAMEVRVEAMLFVRGTVPERS